MALEQISFYNSEMDEIIEVEVSAADVKRARNYVTFATLLMNAALQDQSASHEDSSIVESETVDETEDEIVETDVGPGETSEAERMFKFRSFKTSLYRWSTPCIMEEIFSKKAWCNLVAVASSTGLCVQQPKDTADSDSACSVKSSKTTNGAKSLLAKRLKQKEIHEENRNKRHRD
ncbi:uncharacterized protein LOC125500991 [Athalia rosae]|uniref:uncharacterized protein LOC125500991 n=1 Tax=Athalia rosae TaxID=37344 RepID=UPI0020342A8C|nr:uncharacterized protein LOC125500991 [Athalia rosae]